MTEKNLINLGFKKVEETAENSDYKKDWYYYTYDLTKTRYPLVLISYDNEVAKNNGWYVYIADYEDIIIKDLGKLKSLIELFKSLK